MSTGRRIAGPAARTALVITSVALALLILELGCRLILLGPDGLIRWPNFARQRMGISEQQGGSCGYTYDAALGWTSPRNCRSAGYSVDADGFRTTSAAPETLAGPPILVTGSSFAKGEEVGDDETWPAYLQDLTRRRVLNAAVGGYSIDQTVLHTEMLVSRFNPLLVITSFTPDQVRRGELKVAWSREKPYFTAAGDQLELHNVPVPGEPGAPVSLPAASRLLGRSLLADVSARRLGAYKGWYYREEQGAPPGSGQAIACLLMRRLAGLGVPIVVIAEYSRGHWMADDEGKARDFAKIRPVLACAADAGLIALDMSEPLKATVQARGIDELFGWDHHSAAGNRATAQALTADLARRGFASPTGPR